MFNSGIRQSVTLSSSYSNISDLDNAKAIARRLFELYDKDKSSLIEGYEITPMLQDTYRYMNRAFNPSKLDVDSYFRVLDRNGDGRVTLGDLESLCVRYLVGENKGVTDKSSIFASSVESQLDQARKVFKKFDADQRGYIDAENLAPALEESYRANNLLKKFLSSDIQSLLAVAGVSDGKVDAASFDQIFLRSLGK